MGSKNPVTNARAKVKAAIKDLTFEQRMCVLVDVLNAIGLHSLAGIMGEMFAETKREHYKDF